MGKYVAFEVIPKVINNIKDDPNIDIEALNEEWRKNANEGLKTVKDRSGENCPTCELPKGRSRAFPCHKCKIYIHAECVAI